MLDLQTKMEVNMDNEALYKLYLRTFGKVKSGTKLTNKDYSHQSINGAKAFDKKEHMAVSMGCEDVQNKVPMKSEDDFIAKIESLSKSS